LRGLLQSENTEVINSQAAQKLSQMLLAPVAEQLNGQRLLVVGDGILQTIPFAVLPIPAETSLGQGTTDSASLASRPPIPPDPSLRSGRKSALGGEKSESEVQSPPGLGDLGGFEGKIPLLVNHEIVTLPSATAIAISRREFKNRPPAPKTLAVLADPVFNKNDPRFTVVETQPQPVQTQHAASLRQNQSNAAFPGVRQFAIEMGVILDRLEYSGQEAKTILALVPENQQMQAIGFNASRLTATSSDLSQYQIVHLATHGLLNTEKPELSGLVLSLFNQEGEEKDGFLRLHDIYNLNLPAELVVLSACETGLGQEIKGEGLVGLTRGFMYAGAKGIAVSLWSVNDAGTAKLMEKYYQKMLNEGLTSVAAMRAAQLEMWQSQQWNSPYYWSAFVVQGEWR